MKVEVIRELDVGDETVEVLLRVDEEYMDMYRAETDEKDFNQESFNEWMTQQMENSLEGEEWQLD